MRNGGKTEEHRNMTVKVIRSGKVMVAEVRFQDDRDPLRTKFHQHATSVKMNSDKDNPTIGEYLALGRAFIGLGWRMIREANGRVKHIDNMKTQSANKKPRPAVLPHKPGEALSAAEKTHVESAAVVSKIRVIPAVGPHGEITTEILISRGKELVGERA